MNSPESWRKGSSVVVLVPWSWSWSWNGVMIFELCFITYSLDQTVCWRSQCLLTMCKSGDISVVTLTVYTLHLLIYFLCRQHKCKIVGATEQVTSSKQFRLLACAISENFLYVEQVFSSRGLLIRPHRACVSDQLLSQLVFVTCNKHVEFD